MSHAPSTAARRRPTTGAALLTGVLAAGLGLAGCGASSSGGSGAGETRGPVVGGNLGQVRGGTPTRAAAAPAAAVPDATGGSLRTGAVKYGLPSVVAVSVTSNGVTKNGTGTLLVSGTVVTDASLVTGPNGTPSAGVTVREATGDEHPGVVDGVDTLSGLAALRVRDLDAVPIAKDAPDEAVLGAQVVGLGYLSARRAAMRAGSVVTLGRALRRGGNAEVGLFESTAPLGSQGFGGPIVDEQGRVLGITTRALPPMVPGAVVALPVGSALRITKALADDGRVRRAYLGVETVGISPTRAEELRLTTSSGVLLRSIAAGSPASFSTLRKPTGSIDIGGRAIPTGGDVIVQVDGDQIQEPEDLDAAVARRKPGDEVTLTVIRDQDSVKVHIKLGER